MTRRDILGLGAPALSLPPILGAKRQKVLYFTRSAGFEHPVVKRMGSALSYSENILTELGRRAGFDVECTKDGRVFDLNLDAYDAIAFYTSADLTGPSKDCGAPMTLAGKKRLLDAIAAGTGFLGFHACTDSFHSKRDKFETQTGMDPYTCE